MHSLLNSKIFHLTLALLYGAMVYQLTSLGMQIHLLVLMAGCLVLFLGIRYPLFGFLFVFAAMNNFFNLIPSQFLSGTFINKTWDLAFFLLIIFAFFQYANSSTSLKTIKLPFYFKIFLAYLGVCIVSFTLTILKYPFPIIDTVRTFRYHLGYLFIPVLLLYFLQSDKNKIEVNLYKFLNVLYFLSFFFLFLYIVQFIIQKPIFTGYSLEFSIAGSTYLRSIPGFLFLCYFFMWFNLSAWLTNKKMYPAGIIYISLCLAATLFTFTRGTYASVAFTLILLSLLILKTHKVNSTRLLLVGFAGGIIILTSLYMGYLNPFLSRASTIKGTATNLQEGTFAYRVNLVKDRIKLINKNENSLFGLGFVHNKYGYMFGTFRGNYDPHIDGPGLGCADIAWGNIVYRTGWIGVTIFMAFIVSIVVYIFKKFKSENNLSPLLLLELSGLLELVRKIIHMLNSEAFTGRNAQNMAFLFAIVIFLYSLNHIKEVKG